jgi:hypothetical protein
MRRAAKVDDNQVELVASMRKIGAKVFHTHQVGKGFPDLVVAYRGVNYLVEVKDPAKFPSERKLTKDEKKFFDSWAGPVFVAETIEHFLEQVKHHEKRVI